jgi:hypothetical protein
MIGSSPVYVFLLLYHLTRAAGTHNSQRDSQLFDSLTSMFYHIENTKTCGYNLQKYKDIDFRKYFADRYSYQIGKSIKLANTLNIILQYDRFLTNIDIMSSLGDYVLSKYSLNQNGNIDQVNDDFIIGFGVWINVKAKDYTCIFVEDGNFTNNCFQKSGHDPLNADPELVLTDDYNESPSCDREWLTSMKNSFESLVIEDDLKYLSADELMRRLVLNKAFNVTQWCGPVYECSDDNLVNSWIVSYSLPLFSYKKELKGLQ